MKIRAGHKRKQQGFLLALFVILLAVVVIAYVVYHILKALNRIPPRTLPPDGISEVQRVREFAIAELQAELQAEHPGETVTIQSADVLFVPAFVPFPDGSVEIVQRTTNLIDWEMVARLRPGESYGDTNIFPQAFYRAFNASGQALPASTNAGWQLQPLK